MDANWVVKVIDVYPDDHPGSEPNPHELKLSGCQQPVRGDVSGGKFRTGFDNPTPFEPGKPTLVKFTMNDVCLSFRPGHRLMVQVQSSWFPVFMSELPGGRGELVQRRKRVRHFETPGDAHFLTFSCHQRLPLLSKDRTRFWLAESIEAARKRFDLELWAWVFMPEHVHPLIHPRSHDYRIADPRRDQGSGRLGENTLNETPAEFHSMGTGAVGGSASSETGRQGFNFSRRFTSAMSCGRPEARLFVSRSSRPMTGTLTPSICITVRRG